MKKDALLFKLGLFCLFYWIIDIINILFFVQKPEFILWYSVMGLLLTAIALILQSPILISTMFCALFLMESAYSLDFLGRILFDYHFLGISSYVFEPTYSKKDFFMAFYHFLIPPALLIAHLRTKKFYKRAWVGAIMYASTILVLTFLLVPRSGTVNCVHQLTFCRGAFSFILYQFPYPYRIFAALVFVVLGVFIPTNYVLLQIGRKLKWKEVKLP